MANQHRIFKQTVVITALSFLGMLLGLVSNLVSAYFYGATPERDAYLLALVVPTYFTAVMTGVLSMVFVPIFIDCQRQDPRRAWRMASTLINIIGLLAGGLAIAGFMYSRQLVGLLAPGYGPAQTQLTSDLLRVVIPSLVFTSTASLFSSLYYAEHRFIRPALAPIVSVVITVAANVAFNSQWGIKSLAFGMLAGSAASLLMLLPGMLGNGRYAFCLDVREAGVHRVFRAALPLFIVSLLYNFNTGFQRMIAANLSAGSISYLAYATQIAMMLTILTSGGIATTVFPMLSHSWAEKDLAATGRHLARGIRVVLLISLPVTAGILIFGASLVSLLLERGAFNHEATLAVTQCLVLLMGSLVAGGMENILGKVFYATHKTFIFAIYNGFDTLIYFGLAWMLSRWFSYQGLAAASSIRAILGSVACLFMISRILKGFAWRELARDVSKITTAALVLLLAFFLLNRGLAARMPEAALLAVAGVLGSGLYFALTIYVFRIEDARHLLRKVAARIPFLGFLHCEPGV